MLGVSVKSLIDILANSNVPYVIISTTSAAVNALANTNEVPELAVTSVPKTCLIPFKKISTNPASYAKVLLEASEYPVPDAPDKVVGVPVIL